MGGKGLYYAGFNIPLHLFLDFVLSKKSQEKLYVARVFFKKAGMRCEEACGNDAPDVR